MFSLGLFSTYLPYIVLAMFYGAYLGVHSIVKMERLADDNEKLTAKIIHHSPKQNKIADEGKTFYYGVSEQVHRQSQESPDVGAELSLVTSSNAPPVRSCYYDPLFSRPPPITF